MKNNNKSIVDNNIEDVKPESKKMRFNYNYQLWIFVNVLMLVAFIAGIRLLHSFEFNDSTGISYGILATFILFYALNLVNTTYFNKQLDKIQATPLPAYNNIIDNIEYEGDDLLQDHINSLVTIHNNNTDGKVNQNNALDIIANKLARREYLVQLGSNIMVTLGLIGTITGLIVAISGLETVMTSLESDGNMLLPGLKKALSGMGSAFYTTLFGAVLGGFFLKLLHQATNNMAEELVDEIALRAELYVIPFLEKTAEQTINNNLIGLTGTMIDFSHFIETASTRVAEYLESFDGLKNQIEIFNVKIGNVEPQMNGVHLQALKEIDNTLKGMKVEKKSLIKRLFS